MKNKILLAGLMLSLAGYAGADANNGQIKTLTLKHAAHVNATDAGKAGLEITRVDYNTQTHTTTFYFDQKAVGGGAFQIPVTPTGKNVCIHNMKTLAHLVADQIDCTSAQYCAPGNKVGCAAVVHTLTTNGPIRTFLTNNTAICR